MLVLTQFLLLSILIQTIFTMRGLDIRPQSLRWLALGVFWAAAILVIGRLFLRDWSPDSRRFVELTATRYQNSLLIRVVHGLLMLGLAILTPLIVLRVWPYPFGHFVDTFLFRTLVFWGSVVFAASLLKVRYPQCSFTRLLGAAAVVYALVYRFSLYIPEVGANPFAMGWSEGSHFYYSSSFLAEKIYGQPLRWPILNPTRYFLQTIPFLLGAKSIWLHRLWEILLWIFGPLLAGWLLARRVHRYGVIRLPVAILAAWMALFILQGPIWYYLFGALLLVFYGTDTDNFKRTAFFIACASVWAALSRVNWLPLPAVLAGVFYLLEQRRNDRPVFAYIRPPVLWAIIGLLSGVLSQWLYMQFSGNPIDQFGASFTSDLLWYRLLPNSTYTPGILLGIALVLLPPSIITVYLLRGRRAQFDPLTWPILTGFLALFFFGGLVVSVKIGGTDNLHNLDGLIVLVLVMLSYLAADHRLANVRLPGFVQVLAVLVPVVFALSVARTMPLQSVEEARDELQLLRQTLDELAPDGEGIVFLTERHLFTFGEMDGLQLVEPYEKVMLMEMVMSGNTAYLDAFHDDLSFHRFDVIVADQVEYSIHPRTRGYSDENNIWDRNVDYWLLCYYEPLVDFPVSGAQILVPARETNCPISQP